MGGTISDCRAIHRAIHCHNPPSRCTNRIHHHNPPPHDALLRSAVSERSTVRSTTVIHDTWPCRHPYAPSQIQPDRPAPDMPINLHGINAYGYTVFVPPSPPPTRRRGSQEGGRCNRSVAHPSGKTWPEGRFDHRDSLRQSVAPNHTEGENNWS